MIVYTVAVKIAQVPPWAGRATNGNGRPFVSAHALCCTLSPCLCCRAKCDTAQASVTLQKLT
eukprot:5403742-Alexandrium_andersonii.AAC.1